MVEQQDIDELRQGIRDSLITFWGAGSHAARLDQQAPPQAFDREAGRLLAVIQEHIAVAEARGMEKAAKIADAKEHEHEISAERDEYADHRHQNWNYATGARLVATAIRAALNGGQHE